ncbi:MAG: hypothetical protein IT420_10485 [Candidatus Brocadia sp.]|nr:hypothetical protein [Candidatus Brocadia sp.]
MKKFLPPQYQPKLHFPRHVNQGHRELPSSAARSILSYISDAPEGHKSAGCLQRSLREI